MTSSFVCATLNLERKKSTGTEPLQWEMKGHRSRVHRQCAKRFLKVYTRPMSFISQFKQEMCTSILILILKRQTTPKKSKKSMSIIAVT